MRVLFIVLALLMMAVAEQLQNPAPFERLRGLSKPPTVDSPSTVHTLATCTGSPLTSGLQVGFTTDNSCSANPDDPEPSGRECVFTCVHGYNNNDNIQPLGSYRCNDAGAWEVAKTGSCIPQQCYFPYFQPTTGFTFGDCTTLLRVGMSCVLGCETGFAPMGGTSGLVNCDVDTDGVVFLSQPTLVCQASPCSNPPLPDHNAGFSDCGTSNVASGSTCTVACQPGYIPSGSISCFATKWTSNNNPACTAAVCSNPILTDPLKSLGQCGKQTTSTTQTCELGCVDGYEPDVRAGTLISCDATDGSSSSFSGYSFDCVDVNECLIAYPLACGLGWNCTNTIGSFNCSPSAPELDFNVEAKEFYKHYRATKRQHDEQEHGEGGDSHGEGHSRDRRQHSSLRVGEGDGRGGAGGSDEAREQRIARNKAREQRLDEDSHVFIGLKWPLGAPTVVTKLELEVSEDVNSVVKIFNLPFENPQTKHVAFKALKGASYQFTLLVTTDQAGLQRSPPLSITVPAASTP